MKTPLIALSLALLCVFGGLALAQTNGTSISFVSGINTPCQAPTPGMTTVCFTTTSIQVSSNGAAYAPLAGAIPSTFTCDFSLAAGGKATLTNCK